ncbi:hypothetical protein BKA82DRAFT_1008441 [Pisolithus tinctorius]|uniref:G domain-containing protein n=1 Tax=Pisolithus tinctorius Marx 270 TaxID=870435 RepID=A0A0C3MZL6_PISTI|nr:hypothetical protein BKA82DRAFT_1008441 [Pisolithus tinctorius]KIN94314.1 hypothetical protein M404DRAFT_1008441 [Pisolithus tinctorius Marx 270]
MFATEQLSLLVGRKKSRFGFSSQTVSESIPISSADILSASQRQSIMRNSTSEILARIWKKGYKVSTNLGILSITFRVLFPAKLALHTLPSHMLLDDPGSTNSEGLRPKTEEVIEQCPRFRILVIGKSGVGKTSLINRVFGVDASTINRGRQDADVENELTSPQNDRFVCHTFAPGGDNNYDDVASFIEEKECVTDIKGQLHAVWLCFQIPILTHGEQLLDDAAKAFLKTSKEVLWNTPTIVVFTKHDRLVSFMRQKMPNNPEAGQRYLQEHCIQPIQGFTGDRNIAHVAVSSKPKDEQGLKDLINLTQDMVSMSFTSPGNTVSAVSLALADAQRILPSSKVQLSIEVGKQKYWSALSTSANIPGHTMEDCLRVIHTDTVAVWNFYDPCQYLNSEGFRKVMMNMVKGVDAPAESNSPHPTDTDSSTGGVPLIALAPVVLPLNAFLHVDKWVFETYQRLQDVHIKFMTYIVNLTHVLEILFSLTVGMRAKKLTRTAITLAYKAYLASEWMTHAHIEMKFFQRSRPGRDVIFEKLTSMMMLSNNREAQISRALEKIPPVELEKDEEWVEWVDQEVS